MITVNTIDSTNFEVIVEGHTTTTHRVTLTHLYYQKLTNNQVSPEILVEKSFEFLAELALRHRKALVDLIQKNYCGTYIRYF